MMRFSIIIPSYNEGEDIRLSIESALNQTIHPHEILVVDDSRDNTPQIITEYADRGVKLIKGARRGCCGARNLGMKTATGDVILLLNGDVTLPKDFLERILPHYEQGADYVLVESRAFNIENHWARFVEMQHRFDGVRMGDKAEWTEGFSCRREAALAVGLIPGDFPYTFCRDWLLGKHLGEAGFKKVIDRTIMVPHKDPDNFKEYWRVRKARGRFGSLMQYYLYEQPLSFLFFKFLAKDVISALKILLIVPGAFHVARIASYSERPFRDFFVFWFDYVIQEVARIAGEWEGWLTAFQKPARTGI